MLQLKNLLISTFAAAVMLLFGGVNEVNGGDPLTYEVVGDTVTIRDCKVTTSGELEIPSTYEGKPVTGIGSWAFWDCTSLTSVTIPDSVTSIGDFVFHSCSGLTSVTIGNSVTNFGEGAFLLCGSLASVTIPDSVTSIGGGAFIGCSSLTSIEAGKSNKEYSSEDGVLFNRNKTHLIQFPRGKSRHYSIPNSVTTIERFAFLWCSSLTSITIPNSVISIKGSAFENCRNLTSVTIPDSVTSIGDIAFGACSSLTSVTIGNSVTSIGDWAFYTCSSLTSVTIGNSVTSIGERAFLYCGRLTSVTIPDSVTSIGNKAFGFCSSLRSVTILDSVTSIGNKAFEGCTSLKRITFGGDAPFFLGANVFSNVSGNARVFINPDAIGFGETFEGLPVVILEKLEINTFSKSAAPFSLNFESKLGLTYRIEATQNLRQRGKWRWRKIGEVQGTGSSVEFTDWREAIFEKQYYRLKLVE